MRYPFRAGDSPYHTVYLFTLKQRSETGQGFSLPLMLISERFRFIHLEFLVLILLLWLLCELWDWGNCKSNCLLVYDVIFQINAKNRNYIHKKSSSITRISTGNVNIKYGCGKQNEFKKNTTVNHIWTLSRNWTEHTLGFSAMEHYVHANVIK